MRFTAVITSFRTLFNSSDMIFTISAWRWIVQYVPIASGDFSFTKIWKPERQPSIARAPSVHTPITCSHLILCASKNLSICRIFSLRLFWCWGFRKTKIRLPDSYYIHNVQRSEVGLSLLHSSFCQTGSQKSKTMNFESSRLPATECYQTAQLFAC